MNILTTLGIRHILKMKKAHSEALKDIRGYMISSCISAFSSLGIFDDFRQMEEIEITAYAKNKNLDEKILTDVFSYLYSVKILDSTNKGYKLSKKGKFLYDYALGPFSFVSAYAPVFNELGAILKKEKKYGIELHRNESLVAKASAETEKWIPYPIVKELIKKYHARNILDLGCGSAEFLIKLCLENHDLNTYGVDISQDALKYAKKIIDDNNLGKRINLIRWDMFNIGNMPNIETQKIDIITSMFVLHEFITMDIDRTSRLLNILRQIKRRFKDSYLIVCELCKQTPGQLRRNPTLMAEHHLFHALSNQIILTFADWEDIFKKVPFCIVEKVRLDLAGQGYFVLN